MTAICSGGIQTMNENREKKVNKLLSVEVARILRTEVDLDDIGFVTVMGAKISPTLEHATIIISVIPSEKSKEIMEQLKKEIYMIQQILNKRLDLRKVPKIRFEVDNTEEKAIRIEEILDKDNIE